jgi:hypothetical protein
MRWPGRHTPLCVANQIKYCYAYLVTRLVTCTYTSATIRVVLGAYLAVTKCVSPELRGPPAASPNRVTNGSTNGPEAVTNQLCHQIGVAVRYWASAHLIKPSFLPPHWPMHHTEARPSRPPAAQLVREQVLSHEGVRRARALLITVSRPT